MCIYESFENYRVIEHVLGRSGKNWSEGSIEHDGWSRNQNISKFPLDGEDFCYTLYHFIR